jgi:hypothetical protein
MHMFVSAPTDDDQPTGADPLASSDQRGNMIGYPAIGTNMEPAGVR